VKLSDRPQQGRGTGAQDPVVRRGVQLLGPKSSGDAPRGGGEGVGSRARVVVGVFHAVAGRGRHKATRLATIKRKAINDETASLVIRHSIEIQRSRNEAVPILIRGGKKRLEMHSRFAWESNHRHVVGASSGLSRGRVAAAWEKLQGECVKKG
jgi:hypothetical protein